MILINLKPNDGIYVKTKERTLIRNDMKSDVSNELTQSKNER